MACVFAGVSLLLKTGVQPSKNSNVGASCFSESMLFWARLEEIWFLGQLSYTILAAPSTFPAGKKKMPWAYFSANKTSTAWANDPIPSTLQNVFLCLFPPDIFKINMCLHKFMIITALAKISRIISFTNGSFMQFALWIVLRSCCFKFRCVS